jgi:thioredoxin reductase/Pyruvate/2-oxoacid:ferredoxin oxidoreductase delta subunit
METYLESLVGYAAAFILTVLVFYFYFKSKKKQSVTTEEKILQAREAGLHEPISLHPVVDPDICIGSGACISACPEKDILGLVNNKATTIHASRCVGHGACFHACPVEAISLVMGTEKRGVELPHVNKIYESNVPGCYIAGELGGMGLIKNAMEQGKKAVENILKKNNRNKNVDLDLVIVGAGPAGIGASLSAKKNNLKFVTLEQDSLGGTVFSFPRSKIIMTSPVDLPLYGKLKLVETNKSELLTLWKSMIDKYEIPVRENEKVISISKSNNHFDLKSSKKLYKTSNVILAIGRRGSPRKLMVSGEEKEKVAYRLLEPELITGKNVLVVGGGDSAVEAALLLCVKENRNKVTVSYRGESFKRIKPKNHERITAAMSERKLRVIFNSVVREINEGNVVLTKEDLNLEIDNDLVYIFAGGELPTEFLNMAGISITKKFGEVILKH